MVFALIGMFVGFVDEGSAVWVSLGARFLGDFLMKSKNLFCRSKIFSEVEGINCVDIESNIPHNEKFSSFGLLCFG